MTIERDQVYASPALAGLVERYHTWPTVTRQTVAAHAWRVATIYVEIFGMPRAEVLYYALHHDSGELWGGDIPFMVKDRNPGMREASNAEEKEGLCRLGIVMPELAPLEFQRVKLADLLERWEHGRHELRLGNQYAVPVIRATASAVDQRLEGLRDASFTRDLVHNWMNKQREAMPI